MLEVVDEGIGIPAADLDGLGSRFFRASNAMQAEIAGTGLGLRIVQTIVDRHGGTLGIESVEGEGTTVTVRLPLTRVALGGHGRRWVDRGDRAASPGLSGTNSPRGGVVWQTGSLAPVHVRLDTSRRPGGHDERTSCRRTSTPATPTPR